MAQMKLRMAVGGLTSSAKHLWVESPELTEASSDNRDRLGQMAAQPTLTEIAVDQNTTEVIMDSEPIKFGAAEEEMAQPQSAGKPMGETKAISIQESVVWEAWHGWWESLRMAHRMWWVMAAALQDESRGELTVHVKKLMQEEAENYQIWRTHFLEGDSFEEDGMEVDAFGMED